MSIIQDVASEILKHVQHPDHGYRIWDIILHTGGYNSKDVEEHHFQLRIRQSNTSDGVPEISLISLRTSMKINLSDVKANVELTCCSLLNMKAGPMIKKLSTFLQIHLDTNILIQPPTFNGKIMRKHTMRESESDMTESQTRSMMCHLFRVYYVEFIDDIIKLCVGYKLGYFHEPNTRKSTGLQTS